MRLSASRMNLVGLTDKETARIHKYVEYSDCWLWNGYIRPDGYAEMWFRGGPALVMHITYAAFVGKMPEGHCPDHLCRVRHCINPLHLEAVTPRENSLRGQTVAARNAAKTHCKRGHEFTPENTYPQPPQGRNRGCKMCRQLRGAGKI